MRKVKLGIIGVGNMGSGHLKNIKEGLCPELEVAAVADINPDRLKWAREQLGEDLPVFSTAEEMLDSGLIEAALVSVPHYDHPKYAIECFQRNLHVMVEKPAGVYTKQVREMNEASAKSNVKFGLMFNQRTDHIYRKMRELVQGGSLGQIRRTSWIITNWYRPQAYYDSGAWRATWSGEGGGVLLNQCPHNLDLWQWICGMPEALTAYCDTARYHHIEVEDEATILTRYANGASGAFITSTGEYPGTNRLEISGTLGKVVLEGGKLCWWRLREPEDHVRFASPESFARIPADYEEILPEGEERAHAGILQNFADAILHGAALISPGEDGLNELTLSNAAYLSQWQGNVRIGLPFDEAQFDRLLAEHAAASRFAQDGAQRKAPGGEADGRYSERWRVNW